MPRKGYIQTDTHRKAISLAQLGKTYEEIHGEEGARKRIAKLKSHRGEGHGNFGKHHSPERIEKNRFGQLGKHVGEKNGMFGKCGEKSPNFGKKRSPATREKQREKQRKNWQDPKYRETQSLAHKGKPSGMLGKCGEKNPNFGKKHSPERVEKNRVAHLRENLSSVTREKQSIANSKAAKKRWQDSTYREKQVSAIVRGVHIRPTLPELQLGNLLDSLFPEDYKYVGNGAVIIAGKNPDFISINGKKKIIEMFGDFWHKGENPQARINLFAKYGYTTLIIWERELTNESELEKRLVKFHKT